MPRNYGVLKTVVREQKQRGTITEVHTQIDAKIPQNCHLKIKITEVLKNSGEYSLKIRILQKSDTVLLLSYFFL